MSLPKIANALEAREILESKMWFDPLAPEPDETTEAGVEAETRKKEPAAVPKVVSPNPQNKASEQPATSGAPIKEAEAIVPKPELPKVVPIVPQEPPPAISHNL